METSDQTEQRAGRGNGWTNGQRSQQSTNKGQRSTTTSIKQTTNTNTKRMQRQRQRQRRRGSKDLLHLHGSIAEFSRYRPRRYGYAYRVTTATAANANKHTNSWFIMLNGFRKEEEGIYYICMHCMCMHMHCMHAVLLVILEVRWKTKTTGRRGEWCKR